MQRAVIAAACGWTLAQVSCQQYLYITVSIHTYIDDTIQTIICSLLHILHLSSQMLYSNPLADQHTDGYNLINPVVNRRIKLTFLEETQGVCSEWESACHSSTSPAASYTTTFVCDFPLNSCILLLNSWFAN